jgi:hypothetical protein
MRVHVVSDVHGRADALPGAAHGADALICLGDLLLFLDYADYGQGILAELFGAEAARAYVELRTARRFDEAHQPLARRTRIGVTECLNVGHFRATGAPFVLQW